MLMLKRVQRLETHRHFGIWTCQQLQVRFCAAHTPFLLDLDFKPSVVGPCLAWSHSSREIIGNTGALVTAAEAGTVDSTAAAAFTVRLFSFLFFSIGLVKNVLSNTVSHLSLALELSVQIAHCGETGSFGSRVLPGSS